MLGQHDCLDATDLSQRLASGDVTPEALLQSALDAVNRLNPKLNAVVLMQVEKATNAIAQGLPDGPFSGIPFLIKDLGCEAVDFPSHNGSRLLANTRYQQDSAIFERIRQTGVVTFGRTTSPEGGIGAATEAAVYGGPTRNPWNLAHTPGGSSGGSGAAVAAGIVPFAHGSDGGGSVRIPASSCGLFGMKPTRARLPDGPYAGEGWAGMASDGFLTWSVRDSAALLDACQGADSGAPYHAPPLTQGYLAATTRPPRRLRILYCDTDFTGRPIHPDCAASVRECAKLLESLGHYVEPGLPRADIPGMMRAWTDIVACGTALWIQKTLDARGRALQPDDIEALSRSAMEHASHCSGADYLAAVSKIHAFGREMAAVFEPQKGTTNAPCDIILSATLAEPPAEIGRFAHTVDDYVHYRMGPGMVFDYSPFCAVFNASGQPAASLPLGMSSNKLPVGIHLAAPFGADETLIALCAEIEQAQPWHHRRPTLDWAV